jgi:hypothetical protein
MCVGRERVPPSVGGPRWAILPGVLVWEPAHSTSGSDRNRTVPNRGVYSVHVRALYCVRRSPAASTSTLPLHIPTHSARICSTRFLGAIGGRCIGTTGIVYPGTLFHRRQRGIPMHSYENRSQIRALPTQWLGLESHQKAMESVFAESEREVGGSTGAPQDAVVTRLT